MSPTCATCRYFLKNNFYREGECRRYAPLRDDSPEARAAHSREGRPQRKWPTVKEGDWCGDYTSAEGVSE